VHAIAVDTEILLGVPLNAACGQYVKVTFCGGYKNGGQLERQNLKQLIMHTTASFMGVAVT
jgi:hypothetical protein